MPGGAFAQYIKIPIAKVSKKPDAVSYANHVCCDCLLLVQVAVLKVVAAAAAEVVVVVVVVVL